MTTTLELLREGLTDAASASRPVGIEIRQDLRAVDGVPVQPPSYEGDLEIHPRHLDDGVQKVLELDSVGSAANRIEEELLERHRAGAYPLPVSSTTVDPGDETPITITTLEMPHRVFDAWLRLSDGDGNGTPFEQTDHGQELTLAHPRALDVLLETSAHDLLLGVWDSHRTGPHGQLRIARSLTTTLIGVDPLPQGTRAARRDPLNLGEAADLPKGAAKLSEQGLSSIPPQKARGGVSISSARYLGYLSFPSLRRLGFERYDATAVRTMLAALCLYGLRLREHAGWNLRSGCDLEPTDDLRLTLVRPGDVREELEVGLNDARALFEEAVAAVGITDRSVQLQAGATLNGLVQKAITRSKDGKNGKSDKS